MIVGQTYFSMCSTISSVPRKWLTNGAFRGLYMVSVMSRTSTTFLPQRAMFRRPNGRPITHMFVCTPMIITFSTPRRASRFHTSTPESLIASASWISMASTCLRHGEPPLQRGRQSQPPSDWSIGHLTPFSESIPRHHLPMPSGRSAARGAPRARFRPGWSL